MSNKKTKRKAPPPKSSFPWWAVAMVAVGAVLIVLMALSNAPRASVPTLVSVPTQRSGSGLSSSAANAGPKLAADKTKIDLGNVPLGQTVSVSFEITNIGDQSLQFSEAPYIEVKEGC